MAMAVRTIHRAIVQDPNEVGGRMADDHLCGGIGVDGAGGGAIQYEVGVLRVTASPVASASPLASAPAVPATHRADAPEI